MNRILITVESAFYASWFGAHEEKSLRIRVLEKIDNTMNLTLALDEDNEN